MDILKNVRRTILRRHTSKLSPLIYTHINPYGRFEADLDRRIDFEGKAARASGWVYPYGRNA